VEHTPVCDFISLCTPNAASTHVVTLGGKMQPRLRDNSGVEPIYLITRSSFRPSSSVSLVTLFVRTARVVRRSGLALTPTKMIFAIVECPAFFNSGVSGGEVPEMSNK